MIAHNQASDTPEPANDPSPAQHGATPRNISENAPDVAPSPLTDQQRRAAHLLALGRSDREVREQLGLSRYALWRWRKSNPAFRAELATRREILWNNSADRLRSLMPRALKVLSEHMRSNYDRTSFRAATSVLKLAGAGKLAPPNDPTDEREILRHEILKDRLRANDPNTTIDDADLHRKLQELLSDDPTPPDSRPRTTDH